jgi:hypothetical protein
MIIEPDYCVANLVFATRKHFGLVAEELVSENSRGDWTPLELFLAGVRGWEAGLRRFFVGLPDV